MASRTVAATSSAEAPGPRMAAMPIFLSSATSSSGTIPPIMSGRSNPASQIANDLGVDKYQVMYAIYEANKDFFVNNDINAPRADRDYFVDLSIIKTVDVSFAASEVKRHIFCHC